MNPLYRRPIEHPKMDLDTAHNFHRDIHALETFGPGHFTSEQLVELRNQLSLYFQSGYCTVIACLAFEKLLNASLRQKEAPNAEAGS